MEDPIEIPTLEQKQKNRFDRSDIIAFIALAISILGTIISIQETSIMNRQHELMTEQKAATAWPYLDDETDIEYMDSNVVITYTIMNKGIGPAIAGETKIYFGDQEIEVFDVGQIISAYVPGLLVRQTQSYRIGNSVFAPNERKKMVTLVIRQSEELYNALPDIEELFRIEFCYCSIYGDCWIFPKEGWPQPTKDCEIDVFISEKEG